MCHTFIIATLLLVTCALADYPLELVQTIELPPNVSWDVQHWMSDSTYGWACVNDDSIFYRVNLDDSTTSLPAPNLTEFPNCPQNPVHRVLIFRSGLYPDEPTVAILDRDVDCWLYEFGWDRFARVLLPSGEVFGPVLEFNAFLELNCNIGTHNESQLEFFVWPPPPDTTIGIISTRTWERYCDAPGDDQTEWAGHGTILSPGNAGVLAYIAGGERIGVYARYGELTCATHGHYQTTILHDPCDPLEEECLVSASNSSYRRVQLGQPPFDAIQYCTDPLSADGSFQCRLEGIAAQRDNSGTERVVTSGGQCHDPVTYSLLWENPLAQGFPVYAAKVYDSEDERIIVWTNESYFKVFDAATGIVLGTTDMVAGTPANLLKPVGRPNEIVTYEPSTRTVRIYRSVPEAISQCALLSSSWTDEFEEPILDSCWYWVNEDTTHWSLDDAPSRMTIVSQAGSISGDAENVLLRSRPSVPARLEINLSFDPDSDGQSAGLIIRDDSEHQLLVQKTHWGSPFVSLTAYTGDSIVVNLSQPFVPANLFLRLEWIGTSAAAYASDDDLDWLYIGHCTLPWIAGLHLKQGLFAVNTNGDTSPQIPAAFDEFSVTPLEGTVLSGQRYAGLTLDESPYYVTAHLLFPGNMVVEPGVEILFTGHHRIAIAGIAHVVGTPADSIRFGTAYPDTSSTGSGVFVGGPELGGDTSRFEYCVFDLSGNSEVPYAGASALEFSGPTAEVTRCSFRNNCAEWEGGALLAWANWPDYIRVSECAFTNNSALSGGALALVWNPNAGVFRGQIDHCVFVDNHARYSGGGLLVRYIPQGFAFPVSNCTFYDNTADTSAADFLVDLCQVELRNSVLWDDAAGANRISGNVLVAYCDILGGYPGIGNIDSDPLFVSADSGNFHMSEDSPCINSGDPASPPDPDGTRADMGAIPYDGQFIAQPPLLAEPSTLDFGQLMLGDSVTLSLDLINPAGISAVIAGRSQVAPVFSHTLVLNTVIGADDTLTISVTGHALSESEIHEVFEIRYWLDRLETLRVNLILSVPPVPAAPESLSVYRSGDNITLRWQPVTESMGGQPITPSLYVIYASLTESGPFIPIGSATTTSFVHENIIPAQAIYFYRVIAISP